MAATLAQMIPATRTVRAASGRDFTLPRPTIALRLAIVDFVDASKALEPRVNDGDVDALRELADAQLDLLEVWLTKTHPGITRQEIADSFDVSDIPAFMEAINGFEEEVNAAIPPRSEAAAKSGSRQKKTGQKR